MDISLSTLELKDDTAIVVLGASGDLAKKKTVGNPAKLGARNRKLMSLIVPGTFRPCMYLQASPLMRG